ncbi:MAG: TetR/AcrR family transcriptional regulator [Rickettsiales bacterium]|nr:TetR/AcrR family transcriptional regulator [Rickettsiales bacterium]
MSPRRNTKEIILQKAMMLFWENSYESVGVERICQEADVQKGSFYHFFSSKETLAVELVEWLTEMLEEEFLKPAFTSDKPAMQKFQDYFMSVKARAEAYQDGDDEGICYPGCPIGNLISEMSTKSEPIREKLELVVKLQIGYFAQAISQGQKEGSIIETMPAQDLAMLFSATWQGAEVIGKAHNNCELIASTIENMLQIIQRP